MKSKFSYKDIMSFWGESSGLDGFELYKELREHFPRTRTHYELIKKYVLDKHDVIFYEVQLKGASNVSDICFGYMLALKEIRELFEACEYNMYVKKRGC